MYVWASKSLVKDSSAHLQSEIKKYIPSGYQLDLTSFYGKNIFVIYKGDIDLDGTNDYALVLLPDSLKKNEFDNVDFMISERPLELVISNYGNPIVLKNNNIISPHHVAKGFISVVFKNRYLYILSWMCSRVENPCISAEIFKFNKHKKLIHVNSADYIENSKKWSNVGGKTGEYFENYIGDYAR